MSGEVPLRWGARYGVELAERCLARLERSDSSVILADLEVYAQQQQRQHDETDGESLLTAATAYRWMPACSGTDAPAFAYKALGQALLERGIGVCMLQTGAAEISEWKRKFLSMAHDPPAPHIFKNMFDDSKGDFVSDDASRFAHPSEQFSDMACVGSRLRLQVCKRFEREEG